MDREVKLTDIPLMNPARIKNLKISGRIRRHLMDLGFTPGAMVLPLFSAPSGSPIAYRIRGTTVALRRSDAGQIGVLPDTETRLWD